MLVDLMIEGRNVNALADSGSQVNTIMPTFVQQYGFPVLPLEDLVDHPLNLVGLGRKCTSPLGFVILHVQARETGYDEDVVFLVVPDESEFSCRVPLVIGTCTIGRIINVIWESEIDCLSMPWVELLPEMEAALGMEARPETMSVVARQEKLLEKLNLDGLAHWSLRNAEAARELALAYHDVFTLESNELGCTSAIEHEITIENSEPFKEQFRCIPPPLLEEVHASLRDMLEAGAICLSQSPWCNTVVLVRKKDATLCFCVDFRCLNAWMKKDSYPLPRIQEALESMAGSAHFLLMDFKSGFWQIKMALESQQYMAFTVGNLRFYEFTRMPFGLCNAPGTFQHLMQNTLGELMECGARVTRKSTRPAGGTSEPSSHTLMTRCLGGRGHNSSNENILFGTILRGHYSPTNDDSKWIPIGGAGPPCTSL